MRFSRVLSAGVIVEVVAACGGCYGPSSEVVHERNVRRMQPDASGATVGPKAELEWGQLNFLHTVSNSRGGGVYILVRQVALNNVGIDRYPWLARGPY